MSDGQDGNERWEAKGMSEFKKGDRVLVDARLRQSFWARVDVRGPSDCWPWKGTKGSKGYGVVQFFTGTNQRAHRVSLCLATRQSYYHDLLACHHCDNPKCCNPAHLFWGTPRDNTHDAMRKGRLTKPPSSRQDGARNNNARLTADDVRAIRRRYKPRKVTHLDLAMAYGVAPDTIKAIVGRKRWKHVV